MESGIRLPSAADKFYPERKTELIMVLQGLFNGLTLSIKNEAKIKALIVPHAGYIYSGKVAAYGFNQLPVREKQHYIITGPSHFSPFEGLIGSEAKFWQTPLGKIKQEPAKISLNDNFHQEEHSIEVELPFLQFLYADKEFSITCLLTGSSVNIIDGALNLLKNYPESIFIFSSDLSHYLPEQKAREKDKKTIEAILNLESRYFQKEENTACGSTGIEILIEMAKKQKWQGKLISYQTSAKVNHDKNQVVGYASIGFYSNH